MEFGWVVDWVGLWVQSFHFAMGCVGLNQSFGGLGYFGLKKLDARTSYSVSDGITSASSLAVFR